MPSKSPTQRSLANLRERGFVADVVEKWIPGANIRKDLFGIIDIVGIKDAETIGVQATSMSNITSRMKKFAESENLPRLRKAGWTLEIHGWDGSRLRCEDVS